MANTAESVLAIARAEIGYDRYADPQQGTKYGRWFAALTGSSYYGTNGVPYCAMGASWCFDLAKAVCVGLPGAYCPTMLAMAQRAGKVLSNKKAAKPGDVLYFDWDGDGVVDHVGIVEKNLGSQVQTIEFNTSDGNSGSQGNGGKVCRRYRPWTYVYAVVRPDYDGASTDAPDGSIDVDGWGGNATVTKMQRTFKTYVDGKISGQDSESRHHWPALVAVEYDGGGSQLVEAIQTWLNTKGYGLDADGHLGPKTIKAIQCWLNTQGYSLDVDGYLGCLTMRAIQETLNSGKFGA